ncbi:hypothetical protein [Micromonospora sp. NPDC048063]|uniref:hypothetical protein n=1 Tax=Micromonospora sp. NPDC048063 TaxID=3364256 RepID=UPI0037115FBE
MRQQLGVQPPDEFVASTHRLRVVAAAGCLHQVVGQRVECGGECGVVPYDRLGRLAVRGRFRL